MATTKKVRGKKPEAKPNKVTLWVLFSDRNQNKMGFPCFWKAVSSDPFEGGDWVELSKATKYTTTDNVIAKGTKWMKLDDAIEMASIMVNNAAVERSRHPVDTLADRHAHSVAPDNQGPEDETRFMIQTTYGTNKPLYWNTSLKGWTDIPHASLFVSKSDRHLNDALRMDKHAEWVLAPQRGEFFDPDESHDVDDDDETEYVIYSHDASVGHTEPLFFSHPNRFVSFDECDTYNASEVDNFRYEAQRFFQDVTVMGEDEAHEMLEEEAFHERTGPVDDDPSEKDSDRIHVLASIKSLESGGEPLFWDGEFASVLPVAKFYGEPMGQIDGYVWMPLSEAMLRTKLHLKREYSVSGQYHVEIVKVRAYVMLNRTMDAITNDLASGLENFAMTNFLQKDESETLATIYRAVSSLKQRSDIRLKKGVWGDITDEL